MTIKESYTSATQLCEDEINFLGIVQVAVKSMFREACFAKWNGKWLPVLVLSPYDCADETIRRNWHMRYRKYLNSQKGSRMKHLVLWYGYENVSERYGFVDEFKCYEEGKKEGLHLFLSNTTGKQLTTNEHREVDGLYKLSKAIDVPAKDRLVRDKTQLSRKLGSLFSNYEAILNDSVTEKESTLITRRTEDESNLYTVDLEKTEFYRNEQELLPFMQQLKDTVTMEQREHMFSLLIEISAYVHGMAPSFLVHHGIPKLFKQARKTFEDEEAKGKIKYITDAMNSVYNDKKNRRPKDFTECWVSCDMIQEEKSRMESTSRDSIEMFNQKQQKRKSNSDVLQKSKKPHFSIKRLIDVSQQSAPPPVVVDIKKEKTTSLPASFTPKWLIEELQCNLEQQLVENKDRALGKTLLSCIDVDWPQEISQVINFESFIHHIEQAVFHWSQIPKSDNACNIRKRQEKVLKYPDNYWKKIQHIISGLSIGNDIDPDHKPRLLDELLLGKYPSPMDLVKLPGSVFYNSMKGYL